MDLLISLCVLALFAVGTLFVVFTPCKESEYIPESRQLEATDEPLMTDDEKKVARARGIIEYHVYGTRYYDPDLPPEYYR